MSSRWGRRSSAVLVAVMTLFGVLIANPEPAAAATFAVDSVGDAVDTNPGDGTCDDGAGNCTLRAAIMEANAFAGTDSISFALGSGTFFLLIGGSDEDFGATGDLDITESVTITGTGAGTTVIEAGNSFVDRIMHVHAGATVTLADLTVSNGDLDQSTGDSGEGGGILNEGSLTLDGVTISGNQVATSGQAGRGGGVASLGPIVIRDSLFTTNAVDAGGAGALGGGLYHADTATVTGTTFTANEVTGSLGVDPERGARGGAIYSTGPLDFSDGTISNNQAVDDFTLQAQAYGGAIFATADVTITRSSVTSNLALATEGESALSSAKARGGAIAISGLGSDLRLDRTTLSDNGVDILEVNDPSTLRGSGHGGAVFTEQVAKLHVVNSTFSGNTARTNGGAVYHTGSDAFYANATVSLNTALVGGGLAGSGVSSAANSIFAGNTATSTTEDPGNDCKGSIESDGYNLLGDSAGCTLVEDPATSRIDVDPKLGPLADNGGPTLTHAVLNNFSPAAGSGNPATPGTGAGTCESTDQRGVARPGGQRCDIGAFESPYLPAPPLSCNGLTATINGTPGDDELIGTPGDDVIAGGDGNDTLVGNGGNDLICGGDGDDDLSGGDGDDTLFGDAGADTIRGGTGNDEVEGGTGDDILLGDAGADTLSGSSGNDELRGGVGDDSLVGGGGNDTLLGEAGADVLQGLIGDDNLFGGDGNDTLYGQAGADLLRGQSGDDVSYGGDGDDRIQDGPGADVLWGGADKDKLWGGNGNDQLYGEDGNDQLRGNRDDDMLNGGDGTDRIWGDSGDDRLFGAERSDFLYGGIGDDYLSGGDGNDRLFGWSGNDELYGNAGRDQLRGQAGVDLNNGGPGVDFCSVEQTVIDCEIEIL